MEENLKKRAFFVGSGVLLLSVLGGAVFFLVNDSEMQTYTNPVMIEKPRTESVTPAEEAVPAKEGKTEEPPKEVPRKLDVSVKEKTEAIPAPTPPLTPDISKMETAPQDTGLKIIDRLVSFGYSVSKQTRTIDTVVLHSSYDAAGNDPYSVSGVLKEWEGYQVAPHYLIDREGNVYRLVEDRNTAYHAGASKMPDGRTNVNDFSIGIEILNTKEDRYTDAEYSAVNSLIASLKKKYSIKNVVGHSDIAPGRKTDPWNFDWKRMK